MEQTTREENLKTLYLKILEIQCQYSSRRWTIATFFFGISFAIVGFSYQTNSSQIPLIIQHITAIFVYWFSYYLFIRLHRYSEFLRSYLKRMEETSSLCFDLETQTQEFMKKKEHPKISSTKLLGYLGILYMIVIGITWFFVYQ